MLYSKNITIFLILSQKKTQILFFNIKSMIIRFIQKKKKPGYTLLYKIFLQKLDTVKQYLDSHLAKKLIQTRLVSYFLSVFFIKKPDVEIKFCVDYKKLNAIIKKHCYLISLIKEILV